MARTESISTTPNRPPLEVMLTAIRKGWLTVVVLSVVGLFFAIVKLHITPPTYTATLVAIPTQNQADASSGRLGDLASIAGLGGAKTQISPFALYAVALHSRVVADALAARPEILHRVFSQQWDEETNSWREPHGLLHRLAGVIKPVLGMPVLNWHPPGGSEMQDFLSERVMVNEDQRKAVDTLTYDDKDPAFAAYLLQTLHDTTDHILRVQLLDRASKYADYIESKLASEQNTDLRGVLVQNLSQQETLMMMGNSNTSFAAQPLGQAQASAMPTQPKPLTALFLGMLIGAVLGAVAAVLNIRVLELPFGFLRRRVPTVERLKAAE